MISLDIGEEELLAIQPICEQLNLPLPTMVTDIYKNRGGRYYSVKIFRVFDKGNCRMTDLFMTTQFHEHLAPRIIFREDIQVLVTEEEKGEIFK